MGKDLQTVLLLILWVGIAEGMAQEREITGRVTGKEDAQGIPGVNVLIQGTTRGTTTDAEGNFKMSIEASDSSLVFSFVGYKTQIVSIGVQTNFAIVLESETSQLQEVVVVGYGVQNKSDFNGTISSIKE